MTQVELDRKLKQHRLWLETRGAEGERADLLGSNLRRATLRGANLRGAVLQAANLLDANLRGANLQDANLLDANLLDANLQDAELRGADLRGANLRSANLRGAKFDINIRDCWGFAHAKFTPDALPWLILHPEWTEFKGTVQIHPS